MSFEVLSEVVLKASQIESEWLDLQTRSDCSYFQSWGFISCWLNEIAIAQDVIAIRVYQDDLLIGLGCFVPGRLVRQKIIHIEVMFLNEYPQADSDICIEYNGLLAQAGSEQLAYQHALQYLVRRFPGIDEIRFGALSPRHASAIYASRHAIGWECFTEIESKCWQANLSKIKPGLDAYLASLGKNSRAQIRQTLRLYEHHSPVSLKVAESIEQAFTFFDGLKELHQKHWISKKRQGSFAHEKWESFHRSLIKQRFLTGEIQLIKIANAQQDIAYLYNYVWKGHVYVLQMGFNYSENKRLKPGYLAHAMAISYNRDAGNRVYDFMHGDSRYKCSLSDMSSSLKWIVFQRSQLRFKLEKFAINILKAI